MNVIPHFGMIGGIFYSGGKPMPSAHRSESDAASRILALYSLLLFSGQEYSLRQLAEKLSCSRQTILRLCDRLETFGAELRIETFGAELQMERRGRENWYRLKQPETSPKLALPAQALSCLAMCRNIAAHLLPKEMVEESEKALQHASMLLHDLSQRNDAMASPVVTLPKGAIDYAEYGEKISRLMTASKKKSICIVSYQKDDDAPAKEHHFLPLSIIGHNGAWYTEGWLVSEKGPVEPRYEAKTMFAVRRIRDVTITPRSVRQDSKFDQQRGRGTFGVMAGEPFRAVVEISPAAAQYVRERKWSEDQVIHELPTGGLVLEFSSGSAPEVISLVLSFGPEAVLKAPDDLRAALADRIAAMGQNYAR